MKRSCFHFQFEIPDNWTEEKEGNQYRFSSPDGELLNITGYYIEKNEISGDTAKHLNQLYENAKEKAVKSVLDSKLNILTNQTVPKIGDLLVWVLSAETKDKHTINLEAIIKGKRGVLLITFKAPNKSVSQETYNRFMQSVKNIDNYNVGFE